MQRIETYRDPFVYLVVTAHRSEIFVNVKLLKLLNLQNEPTCSLLYNFDNNSVVSLDLTNISLSYTFFGVLRQQTHQTGRN